MNISRNVRQKEAWTAKKNSRTAFIGREHSPTDGKTNYTNPANGDGKIATTQQCKTEEFLSG